MIYYLALGSNLGDRLLNIKKAINFLNTLGVVLKISSIYETEPVGMAPGTENFYNLTLSFKSSCPPRSLISKIKNFEKSLGRDIHSCHKRSRPIDIDILLAGDQIIKTKNLVVPHEGMAFRGFVLIPLKEIAPKLIHPVLKKTIENLLLEIPADKQRPVRKLQLLVIHSLES